MKVGSLFSGIGGLDLGLERAGMTVKWQAEVDPYCSRVLAKHWPDVPNLGDVTEVDWEHVERVDLICGGYPCQPFSLAGARRGHDDPRHLWPRFADALRVLRPRFALLENVPGHLSLGFGDVLGDLAALGYDTEWDSIPAAAVGAPHLRYRIFVVAHHDGTSGDRSAGGESGRDSVHADEWVHVGGLRDGARTQVADADGTGSQGHGHQSGLGRDSAEVSTGGSGAGSGTYVAHTQIFRERPRLCPSCSGGIGWGRPGDIGCEGHAWATEPDVGRVANGVPARVDRLRALGNAVVPQVAEWIGTQLLEAVAA